MAPIMWRIASVVDALNCLWGKFEGMICPFQVASFQQYYTKLLFQEWHIVGKSMANFVSNILSNNHIS